MTDSSPEGWSNPGTTAGGESRRRACRAGKGSAQLGAGLAGKGRVMLGRCSAGGNCQGWIQAPHLLSLGAEGVPATMISGAGMSKELNVAGLEGHGMPRPACCRALLCSQTQQQWLHAVALPAPSGMLSALINVTV